MSTDAIIPSMDELTRSTDLPAERAQQSEEIKERQQMYDLTSLPAWRTVEETFEQAIETYDRPKFDPAMALEEIGKQALFSQTIAAKLKEILDDIRAAARG